MRKAVSCSGLYSLDRTVAGSVSPSDLDGGDAAPDSPSGGDGAGEAGPSAGAWCALQDASFCDDFDDGGLGATWTDRRFDADAGSFAGDNTSPPRSFALSFPSTATTKPFLEGHLTYMTQQQVSGVVFAFDVEIVAYETPGDGNIYLASIEQGEQPRASLSLHALPDAVQLQEQIIDVGGMQHFRDSPSAPKPLVVGQWTHVEIDADFTTHQATLRVGNDTVPFGLHRSSSRTPGFP